ncbi:hypothetical protein K7432_005397 [Basidiobolus ranarum]|uniref:LIM zinc-binding domain-containing protein n=1 Tax=Basidiobolus ranarum TaxID=34480 RepID=A0ABR2WWJ1_9FUNG
MRDSPSPRLSYSSNSQSRKRHACLRECEQPSAKRITSEIRRYHEAGLPKHTRRTTTPEQKRRVSNVNILSLIAKFDNGHTPRRFRRSSQTSQDSGLSLSSVDTPSASPLICGLKQEEEIFIRTSQIQPTKYTDLPKPQCVFRSLNSHGSSIDAKAATHPLRCSICCRMVAADTKTYAVVDGEYYCPAHFSITIPVALL